MKIIIDRSTGRFHRGYRWGWNYKGSSGQSLGEAYSGWWIYHRRCGTGHQYMVKRMGETMRPTNTDRLTPVYREEDDAYNALVNLIRHGHR